MELQDSRRSTRSVLEYLQNTTKSCVRLAITIHPLPQAAQGHAPTLHLDPPLKTSR